MRTWNFVSKFELVKGAADLPANTLHGLEEEPFIVRVVLDLTCQMSEYVVSLLYDGAISI